VLKDRAPSGSSVAVEVTAPPIGTVHQPPASNSICVLLVEDDQVLRAVSADTLNDLGYRTIRTSDGMQALTALERDRDIRILMTDIELPGMDGQQLAAEARRRRPGLGVLFVTGYDGLIREGRLHREEGVEYLAKPYGCDDLAKALRRLLGSESKSRM
jgi:CheY-like chemotaxis protein